MYLFRYEGTGRSLSLKLFSQLRKQSSNAAVSNHRNTNNASKLHSSSSNNTSQNVFGRSLHEVTLNESIRYGNGDPIESWLYELLCLDVTAVPRIISGCPLPAACDLYYVNRDTLFSYHKASEAFLQRLMSLYVSSHYKVNPTVPSLLQQ